MTTNNEGTILLAAVTSFKINKPINVANIMLISLKEETYAIGRYCIHQTAKP